MVKILIADTDVKRNSASCQFLANEKGFEIESTNDGSSTIKKYLEIEPNIFILDSNFKDIKTLEIIDRLSTSPIEKRKKKSMVYYPLKSRMLDPKEARRSVLSWT